MYGPQKNKHIHQQKADSELLQWLKLQSVTVEEVCLMKFLPVSQACGFFIRCTTVALTSIFAYANINILPLGTGNIGPDDTQYVDGGIHREGDPATQGVPYSTGVHLSSF